MDFSTLCFELLVRDLKLHLKGTKLVCTGPAEPSPEIRAAIRQHKDELLRQLLENAQAQAEAASGERPTTEPADHVEAGIGDCGAAREPGAWVEIFSKHYSPAAADLYRRSVPFTGAAANDRCWSCSGTRFWRLRDGCPWVCARCHPSDQPPTSIEWRETQPATGPAAVEGKDDPKAIPPPTECRSCGSPLSWLRAGESAWRCRECDPPPTGETPALLGRLEDAP